ncbi:MAG: dipicolinate synthase subunit B [Clostridia bacterium]|nr:dipicolinate synthase subunit B [Clostridia bacterium]
MNNLKIGFAMCGSFCTFDKATEQMELLKSKGAEITPVMSQTAYSTDTRFGKAYDINRRIESICQKSIIHTVEDAEPIGPKKMFDILIVEPCTGNTLAKLACGITDTAVTMACKSHIRNSRPILLAVSTNDALGSSAKNIGQLLNFRNVYFLPMRQDNCTAKPRSVVADFSLTENAMLSALKGEQLQPIITA